MAGRYRWFVVGVFFTFMLLHQADKLLIGPLLTDIRATFNLTASQAGAIGTGGLLVAALLYPVWGYLYDRYARAKLLALASAIWGVTTWLGAIAPNYPTFLAARSSTGIDDSSYPGLYSLITDYFPPGVRGKIYGLLQLTAPMGYMLGLVLAIALGGVIGWRNVFLLTGSLGIVLAVIIFFFVKEMPRGKSEPELEAIAEATSFKFNWTTAKSLLRKRTLIPLFIQGFFGVFPLNVFSIWFFNYLQSERGYSNNEVLATMAVAVLTMAGGALLAGILGDALFKRTKRGRLIVAATGVFAAAIMIVVTINLPPNNKLLFGVFLAFTTLFVLFSGPNVISTVYDITLPEVRSTALAIQYFIESIGAASAPLLAGLLADRTTNLFVQGMAAQSIPHTAFFFAQQIKPLEQAILLIALTTYALCGLFLIAAMIVVPPDITALRQQLKVRAATIQAEQQHV